MITLPGDLIITADNEQYIVGRTRTRADKGIIVDKPRYYPNLGSALRAALQQAMRDKVSAGEITTLQDFIQEQNRLRVELSILLEPLEGKQ